MLSDNKRVALNFTWKIGRTNWSVDLVNVFLTYKTSPFFIRWHIMDTFCCTTVKNIY